jgi:hypothetical protein
LPDPLNFSLNNFDHWVLPINKLSDTELQDAIKCIEQLGGGWAKAQLLKLMHENLPDHAFAISSYQSAVTRNVTMRKGVKSKLASVHVCKNVWTNVLDRATGECGAVAKVAMRLLSMHATACASERNWSKWGRLYDKFRSALSLLKGEMMVIIAENDEHSDLRCDEDLLIDAISS